MSEGASKSDSYWKANLRLVGILMAIWFVVSFGFGILLVEPLNAIHIGGFKLGFWFAQQGSIFAFIALIFVYVRQMHKLDLQYGVDDIAEPHSYDAMPEEDGQLGAKATATPDEETK